MPYSARVMSLTGAGDPKGNLELETCGHGGPPRRVCDVCKRPDHAFLACSNRCLRAHREVAHDPALPADTALRLQRAQAEKHRLSPDVWDRYAPHREQVMKLLPPGRAGESLCVFGAGKCDDLDLPRLAERFARVHLVDLDTEAMERARDRQPARVREAIVLHGALDLSGLLAHLDDWGEAFPDDRTLAETVFGAAHAIVGALGGPFDVTVSTCVMSQLTVPFQSAWTASEETWGKLLAATSALHLAVLARSTAAQGHAILVFDVLSSDDAPTLAALGDRPSDQLEAEVAAGVESGAFVLRSDPNALVGQIASSGLSAALTDPHLTGPWLWDTGAALQLVYALSFRAP